MALAPKYYEEKYKNLTKEELEKKFNEIRNNKSYAHDNDILNRAESLLIYRNIVAIYEFIKTIEKEVL